jgi:hypothetical protein
VHAGGERNEEGQVWGDRCRHVSKIVRSQAGSRPEVAVKAVDSHTDYTVLCPRTCQYS